jgi:hypothetical protein
MVRYEYEQGVIHPHHIPREARVMTVSKVFTTIERVRQQLRSIEENFAEGLITESEAIEQLVVAGAMANTQVTAETESHSSIFENCTPGCGCGTTAAVK